ncbi:hypothetical protein HK405_003701 [Cladochytrium tenue]|nr:hypothetical protein HK405_003701 [Cladochytrium tenue]
MSETLQNMLKCVDNAVQLLDELTSAHILAKVAWTLAVYGYKKWRQTMKEDADVWNLLLETIELMEYVHNVRADEPKLKQHVEKCMDTVVACLAFCHQQTKSVKEARFRRFLKSKREQIDDLKNELKLREVSLGRQMKLDEHTKVSEMHTKVSDMQTKMNTILLSSEAKSEIHIDSIAMEEEARMHNGNSVDPAWKGETLLPQSNSSVHPRALHPIKMQLYVLTKFVTQK